MANYPYSSPPPPPSPCNNTTSPILLPPPPPPPPACNHTSTPTLSPPPQSHYSHSPPSLSSPSPTPSPACTCNKNTTALPPPPPPLPSPPPPSPPSYYHSPPLASPSPPPPSTHYSPPVHSPPPPTPSYPLPPPKPSKTQASPPPLLQPTTPPPSSSPYYFPQTPLHSPQSPDPPLCHCVCPSPSATPPNHYNSIPPNYYDSIAPAPHFMSPSNGQRTVIVTTFVSLGGVFFLSFIVIGLLSMVMKKRMPRMPRMSGREQPDSHVQTQGDVHKFESIPATAGTSTEHSVIDMGDHGLDPKPVENPKVQQVVALPDKGAGKLVEQALHQTSNPNVTDKKSSDTEFRKPSGEQSATHMDAPQGPDEGNLDKSKSNLLDDQSVTDNADTSPNVEEESQEVGDESNDSKKKLRLPKKKKSPSNNPKKGNEKRSGVRQGVNVACTLVLGEAQQSQDADDDEERPSESEPHDEDEELIAGASNNPDENVEQPNADEQDAEERDDKPLTPQNAEESPIGEESNDTKQKLRLPNKKKPPSRVAKKGNEKRSGVRQGVNVARTLVLGEAQQSQDADDDEERPSESEPYDEDEEFIASASNNPDENVEQPDADEQDAEEREDKPLTPQNAEESPIGEESNDTKQKLRLPNKKKPPSRVAKKGNEKRSGVRQGVNVARTLVLGEAQQSQDADDDEERPSESEPHDEDEELIAGASNNPDENVEQPNADEQDAEERDDKPLTPQNAEESPIGEESNDTKQKLRLPNKKKPPSRVAKKGNEKRSGVRQGVNVARTLVLGEAQQSQDADDDEERPSESEPYDEDEEFIASASNNPDENVEQPDADEQDAEEREDKPLTPQNAEESPIGEESNDTKQKLRLPNKKKPPSRVAKKGNEKRSGVHQGVNVARTLVLGEAQQSQDSDDDEERASESEPHDEGEELIAGASNNPDENVEQPDADEQDAEEREDKPLTPQNAEEIPIGEESNDTKQKLRLPNKKKPPSRVAKKGNEKRSGVRQGVNVARTLVLGEAQQSQDAEDDEERASESEPYDKDEELIAGASNNPDENVEQPDADEQDAEERDDKPLTPQNVEESPIGEESNDTKQKLRLPNKKKPPSRVAKKEDKERSRVRQGVNVARTSVLDEAQQSQDAHDDEEQASESKPHDEDEEFIAGASYNTDENVEQPDEDEQDAEERDDKPLTPQNVEESPIGEESNDSKQKLRLPNKKKPPSRLAKKEDKERSRVRQGVNVARISVLDEAQQSQDGDDDEERASESEPHDEDKELIAGASNNTDENVEQPTADEQDVKHDDKPFSHQTETHSRDSRQNMEEGSDAVGEESNYSKQNLHLPKKKKSPRSGAKKGNTQPYGVCQVLNPPNIYDPKEVENSQVGDNDEEQNESGPQDDEEPYESEPQDNDEELIPGGSNITDEIVEQPTTDEQEADEHDNKRLSHQTWTSNRDSGQNVEKGFNAAGEESSYSKKKLRLPKKKKSLSSGEKKGDEKRYGVRQVLNVSSTFSQDEPEQSQDGDNNEEQVRELDAQDNDKALFLGGLTSADEKVEHSTADEQEADECDDKTFSHQTETNNRNSGQNVEEGSNAVIEELNDSKNKSSLAKKKRSPSSGAKKGNEKSSSSNVAKKENEQPYGIRQVLSPASIFDSEGVEKSQDDNINEEQCELLEPQDGEEPYESEPHDDEEPYEEVQPQPNEEQSRRQEDDNDDVEVEESECVHDSEESNSCANDSSRVMISLDDLGGKLKVSDPFSSARGSKQALSKAMGVVGDDYKDGKAKVHELKSGGSNKDSQGQQHHTQIRGAKKPLNFGKIGTTASDSDPGKALVIFDNEDDKVEESEPFASNVDSYLGQLQTSAPGIEQSPNIFQNLTSTIDDDPAEGLKSLRDGHYKGKKAVHQLSKDSRRIKGQIIPPNRSEIVTTKSGDDLGKGMESLGGNQGEGSEKDGSSKDVPGSGQTSRGTQQLSNLVQILTATNEGDPNPKPGVYEDDKEYLSLEEPSPGEMEPSTDDQSASVTVDDDDPDVLQFHNNEYDEESAESNKDAPPGKPLSRPRTTNLRGKRRA